MSNSNSDKTFSLFGVDSEYGVLRDVLLGRPDYYRWVEAGPIIRRTMENAEKTGIKFNLALALAQHKEMVGIYESAGVSCHFLAADEILHRNFFARDSSVMTPWGPIISHMQLKCRRADYATAVDFYQRAGIPIWRFATAGYFEGGDLVIVEPGAALVGYGGTRSDREGAQQVAGWFQEQGWEAVVVPIPSDFVHLDALLVPAAPKLVVACSDVLEDWTLDWLRARQFKLIDVSYRHARDLGVNLVSLGNERVLSMKGDSDVNDKLRAHGLEVFAPDMSMFTLGGGGVHCLCQALRRDPA